MSAAGADSGASADPLGDTVRALFADLSHAGELCSAAAGGAVGSDAVRTLCGEAGRAQLGTQVRFSVRLAGRRILEVRYRAYGCPYTLATCEWLARRLAACELSQRSAEGLAAAIGGPADWAATLAVPAAKLGRLLVIEDALRAALTQP